MAVPKRNKEAATVTYHLVNDVFKVPGPPRILQSDNGKEFVADIITLKSSTAVLAIRNRKGK